MNSSEQNIEYQKLEDGKDNTFRCSTFKKKDQSKWLTEAYDDFKDRLCFDYLVTADVNMDFDKLIKEFNMVPGNSSVQKVDFLRCFAWAGAICIIPTLYYCSRTIFEVNNNSFAFVVVRDQNGTRTEIYGPGEHVLSRYHTLDGIHSFENNVQNNIFQSSVGDLKIAIVNQGTIMHLTFGGQNIILGPGIHKIRDPVTFKKIVSLDSFYIEIGPEKWVTIPDGYDGISVNRGKIQILKGGKQHHLPHVGDKFVKMVPLTLQTDKVPTDIATYVKRHEAGQDMVHNMQIDPAEHLTTTTAEGATITLDAMIFWRILDTELASKTAMEILKIQDDVNHNIMNQHSAIQAAGKNIGVLKQTVLRIAKNHLTTLVGTCSLAGKYSLQAEFNNNQSNQNIEQQSGNQLVQDENEQEVVGSKVKQEEGSTFEILQFLQNSTVSLRDLINEELNTIGCQLDNICIYSVIPSREIQQELDKQTKAKVDANTAVISALSKQQAQKIDQQLQLSIQLQNAENDIKVKKMQQQIDNELKIQQAQNEIQMKKMKQQNDNELKIELTGNDIKMKKMNQENDNNIQIQQTENQVKVQKMVTENENTLALQKAETEAEVLEKQSEAQSKATIKQAEAESEAIIKIAQARQEEAEKLQGNKIASDMAMMRVAGESGEKVFKGQSNKFVFGKNPGDLLYSMVDQFQQKKSIQE